MHFDSPGFQDTLPLGSGVPWGQELAGIPQFHSRNPEAEELRASRSATYHFDKCMAAEVATSAPAMDLTMTMLVAFVRLSLF